MNVNIYIRRIISWFISIIVVIGLLAYFQDNYFIFNSSNSWCARNFYREQKNSLDVVFLGASEVYTGFYPGLAYENYGFTSYPFAFGGQSGGVWKSQINEIKKTQSPKLFVVEIGGILYENDTEVFDDAALRRYVDNIPLSNNKISTLLECNLKDDFFSYCFPFLKYHGDFENAKAANREKIFFDKTGFSLLKGIYTLSAVDNQESYSVDFSDKLPLNVHAEMQLIDFLDYCVENRVDNILFTRFPRKNVNRATIDEIKRKNTAREIISKRGFDFIDFSNSFNEIGLDSDKDFYNPAHMNVYGAEKFTLYFSEILKNNYGITSSVLDSNEEYQWKKCQKYTRSFISLSKEWIADGKKEWIEERKDICELLSEL